jgi:hypothetical protein
MWVSSKSREYQERIKRAISWPNPPPSNPVLLTADPEESELAARGISFTPLGLRLAEDLSESDWVKVGRLLDEGRQKLQWCLGDWAAFGLAHYDNGRIKLRVLQEFAKSSRTAYQTLANYASVSRAIPISRRRENLDWSIHEIVAGLSPRAQTKWLARAEAEHLPCSLLRREIRISQGEDNALASDGPALELGSNLFLGWSAWLHGRPEEFWTAERKAFWLQNLQMEVEYLRGLTVN